MSILETEAPKPPALIPTSHRLFSCSYGGLVCKGSSSITATGGDQGKYIEDSMALPACLLP